MNRKAEMRRLAIGAARAEMRRIGVDPLTQSSDEALLVLDDLSRLHSDLVAVEWYRQASENQLKLFDRDWRYWLTTHVF